MQRFIFTKYADGEGARKMVTKLFSLFFEDKHASRIVYPTSNPHLNNQ